MQIGQNNRNFGFLAKKPLVLLAALMVLVLGQSGNALSSSNYSIPGSIAGSAGGKNTSVNYHNQSLVGVTAAGKNNSASFSAISGTGIIIVTTSASAPAISNLKIDGQSVINNDYVKATGLLTATITSDAGLNLNTSSVEVDGTATTFAALSGGSTYDATTKLLTYQLNLSGNTNHSITIHAADTNSQSATASLTVKVDNGALKTVAVYCYPNPYNPNSGNARIAYQLNQDANTSIYLFNAAGELVYKRNYTAGSAGGRVGYNEVTWNGQSDFGATVGNDIYFLRVVSDGRPIGKAKIAVIK